MNQKNFIVVVWIVALGAGGYLWFSALSSSGNTPSAQATREGDAQIVTIVAYKGYTPRRATAAAGVPTVLRFVTKGTLDCSSALVIPQLGYQKFLSPSSVAEVRLSATQATGRLRGTCGMGMYSFEIDFS